MMGNAIINVMGFLLIILGLYSFFNPAFPINFINNDYRTMPILDSPSNNSTYNFNFTPELIGKYYEKLDSNLQYVNFVDIYINDFLDNTSINSVDIVTLNNDKAIPVNKSYLYSYSIRESTLKSYNTLVINKSDDLIIDKIQLVYYGSDIEYYNDFVDWFKLMYLLAILFGILLTLV